MRNKPLKVRSINGIPAWGYCPVCNSQITKTGSPKFCKECGQAVKWGEEDETTKRRSE